MTRIHFLLFIVKMLNASKKQGFLAPAAVTALMLFVGLRPFDYSTPNDARWIANGPGIRFSGQGMVTVGSGPALLERGHSAGVTIEIALKPSVFVTKNVPRILSFADRQGLERFYLGQWRDFIILREIDRTGFLTRTIDRIGARGVLIPSKLSLVAIVSDEKGTVLYADGVEVRKSPHLNIAQMMAESTITHISFGNAPSATEGWKGGIYGFSFLNRTLSSEEVEHRSEIWKNKKGQDLLGKNAALLYMFDEMEGITISNKGSATGRELTIPKNLKPLEREFLAMPSVETLKRPFFHIDAAVNLAGFFPFGFLMSLALSRGVKGRRNSLLLWGILASAALSITIELNQAFLLSRDSSITDLILNTAGRGLGGLIFLRLFKRFSKQVGSGT